MGNEATETLELGALNAPLRRFNMENIDLFIVKSKVRVKSLDMGWSLDK